MGRALLSDVAPILMFLPFIVIVAIILVVACLCLAVVYAVNRIANRQQTQQRGDDAWTRHGQSLLFRRPLPADPDQTVNPRGNADKEE